MKKIAGGGSLLNLHRSELFGIAALLIVIGHSQDFVRASSVRHLVLNCKRKMNKM